MLSFSTGETSTAAKVHLGLRLVARVLQFVFAVTVIGLYASELKDTHDSSRYVYAVVIGTASALTSAVFLLPMIEAFIFFAWDVVLFILWTAVFGLMGTYFIDPKSNIRENDHKMRNAVWIDLCNMLLWFITSVAGGVMFWQHRRANHTLHTDRATV